jgi:hypothetical protein
MNITMLIKNGKKHINHNDMSKHYEEDLSRCWFTEFIEEYPISEDEMSLKYIRDTYNVPAKRGGRISLSRGELKPLLGTITSSHSARIRIKFDVTPHLRHFYHPCDPALTYLDK